MILGIAGTLGAGKGTVTEYLLSRGFKHAGVTAFMRTIAEKRGSNPITRETYHDIANEFRAEGPTRLVEATLDAADLSGDVVVEALHTVPEVRFVQSRGGKVLAVDGDIRVRYDRIWKRASEKDKVSFEEFQSFEELEMNPTETTTNDLAGAVKAADIIIMNDGTLEELHAKIDEALAKLA